MKQVIKMRMAFSMVLACLVLSSCVKDRITRTYSIRTPIYASKSAILAGLSAEEPRPIDKTGKIWWYGNYIFMNDPGNGIHIINNSDPARPVVKAFIKLPGNIDIAVKGNILYADLYADMLAIDISDPLNPVQKKLVENIFPERNYQYGYNTNPDQIIIGWNTKDTIVEVDGPINTPGWFCVNCQIAFSGDTKGGGDGIGGSMARFSIVNDYLYTVSTSTLSSFTIAKPEDPTLVNANPFGWNIETVYPFRDKLFIGSSSGMFIADISNPASPQLVGSFSHANACDPVVADDNHAYVTLRTGTECMGTSNQLDVLDITNISNPVLLKTYSMANPFGLGIKGDFLYICDGDAGLKVFNKKQPLNIEPVQRIEVADTYDVIIRQSLLILVASDGLRQYRIGEDGKLSHLSTLKTN